MQIVLPASIPPERGDLITGILEAALRAVEPAAAVERHLRRDGAALFIGQQTYDLTRFRRVMIVGVGKASVPMGVAAARIVGDRLASGILVTKEGHASAQLRDLPPATLRQAQGRPCDLQLFEASHPFPDKRGVRASQRILALLQNLTPDDLVLCLISGGASALFTAPAPGLTLSDLQSLTGTLLACGATIHEINTLRKHLDTVKGGGLARWVFPATMATLILSDVVGDPLEVIASGPTVPDPTTFGDALAVLERYSIADEIPPAVLTHLRDGLAGRISETPKPGHPLFERVQNTIIGSNRQAAEAALEQARADGFHTLLLTTYLQGEAHQAGRILAAVARQIAASGQPIPHPACIVAGGETTVTLTVPSSQNGDKGIGARGIGGRNQELALGAVTDLSGLTDVALVTLATDGGDGPTDAAGAVVTGETLARARLAGLDPMDFLARHDSYHFFESLGDLIKTGPTQTNVNDLAFVFAF